MSDLRTRLGSAENTVREMTEQLEKVTADKKRLLAENIRLHAEIQELNEFIELLKHEMS